MFSNIQWDNVKNSGKTSVSSAITFVLHNVQSYDMVSNSSSQTVASPRLFMSRVNCTKLPYVTPDAYVTEIWYAGPSEACFVGGDLVERRNHRQKRILAWAKIKLTRNKRHGYSNCSWRTRCYTVVRTRRTLVQVFFPRLYVCFHIKCLYTYASSAVSRTRDSTGSAWRETAMGWHLSTYSLTTSPPLVSWASPIIKCLSMYSRNVVMRIFS
jgi:hypothetical protein